MDDIVNFIKYHIKHKSLSLIVPDSVLITQFSSSIGGIMDSHPHIDNEEDPLYLTRLLQLIMVHEHDHSEVRGELKFPVEKVIHKFKNREYGQDQEYITFMSVENIIHDDGSIEEIVTPRFDILQPCLHRDVTGRDAQHGRADRTARQEVGRTGQHGRRWALHIMPDDQPYGLGDRQYSAADYREDSQTASRVATKLRESTASWWDLFDILPHVRHLKCREGEPSHCIVDAVLHLVQSSEEASYLGRRVRSPGSKIPLSTDDILCKAIKQSLSLSVKKRSFTALPEQYKISVVEGHDYTCILDDMRRIKVYNRHPAAHQQGGPRQAKIIKNIGIDDFTTEIKIFDEVCVICRSSRFKKAK